MIADKQHFDVIIVGAGPAGSVTARFAAQNGASVLMLERDREPGIPVRCAEAVSHQGLLPFIEPDKRWIATTIKGARMFSPNTDCIEMINNGTGYVLERRLFDTALCDLACSYGAKMLTKADALELIFENDKIVGLKYKHQNQILTAYAKIIIGADGIESRVGRWAGMKTLLALDDLDTCVQYTLNNISLDTEYCEFYMGLDVSPGGYAWVFPKSATTANVGLGVAGHMTAPGKSPKYYLDKFVERRFPNASINYMVCGGVPTANTLKEIVKDNIMLVGDSARQVNPITGGGIVQVMMAGAIAGRVAAEAVKKGDYSAKMLKKYPKEWDDLIGSRQRFMHELKEKFMFMSDDKFNSIVATCKKIPQEKLTLTDLFKEAIREHPYLVLKVAAAFVTSKIRLG